MQSIIVCETLESMINCKISRINCKINFEEILHLISCIILIIKIEIDNGTKIQFLSISTPSIP